MTIWIILNFLQCFLILSTAWSKFSSKIKSSKGLKEARGILAAPNISSNAKKMLEDWHFEYKQVSPPNYIEKFNKKQKRLGEF
ncbi:MAG: endonuclease NucS [Nanoarchaeota archaeon]|nr:endonuclease NucS [Nanoarchaeota archaeon]